MADMDKAIMFPASMTPNDFKVAKAAADAEGKDKPGAAPSDNNLMPDDFKVGQAPADGTPVSLKLSVDTDSGAYTWV